MDNSSGVYELPYCKEDSHPYGENKKSKWHSRRKYFLYTMIFVYTLWLAAITTSLIYVRYMNKDLPVGFNDTLWQRLAGRMKMAETDIKDVKNMLNSSSTSRQAVDKPVNNRLVVYEQVHSINRYLYQSGLPALVQFSFCFWFNGRVPDDLSVTKFIITIAIPTEDNEFLIGFKPEGNILMEIRDELYTLVTTQEENSLFWGAWHRHCFTWKAGDKLNWYADKSESGKVELISSTDVPSLTIRYGGHMILLQEQDGYGIRLDLTQTAVGKLAGFNMWDTQIAEADINSQTCSQKGNISSWETLQKFGVVSMVDEEFPICKSDGA